MHGPATSCAGIQNAGASMQRDAQKSALVGVSLGVSPAIGEDTMTGAVQRRSAEALDHVSLDIGVMLDSPV